MYAIHWAASTGNLLIVKHIVSISRDCIDLRDHSGCSALMIAVQYNHLPIVLFLINSKCDLTIKDSNGDTALHWAAYKGYEQVLEVLLYFMGEQLNSEDNFGQTCLHLAAMKGHVPVARTLVTKYQVRNKEYV